MWWKLFDFTKNSFLKLTEWYTIPSQMHARLYFHPGFFYQNQHSNFIKKIILHVGSSMNTSLVLMAWCQGKLCGNHCTDTAVGPWNWNWHKLLIMIAQREKHFFLPTVSIFRGYVTGFQNICSLCLTFSMLILY